MNICFVGYFNEKSVNGVATSVYSLAIELVRKGNKVYIYYFDELPKQWKDGNGIHHRIFKDYFKNMLLSKELINYITKNIDEIDIFHLHSVFTLYNYHLSELLKACSIPFLLTPHGGYAKGILNRRKLLKSIYFKLFESKILRNADGVIAVHDEEIRDLNNVGVRGIIKTIPNPFPVTNTNGKDGSIGNYLLYLGRYDIEHKGLILLLDIFKIVSKLDTNLSLRLYGDGKDKSKLLNYIKSQEIDRVSVNDPVFGLEKEKVIMSCLAYIQTSLWEVFGISIIEAMVQRKPVILTKECYFSSFVEDQDIGLVIPREPEIAARKIVEYSQDKDKIRMDGEKSHDLVCSKFSPEVISDQLYNFYEEILKLKKNVR